MSERAIAYVFALSPGNVTTTERFVLRIIAENFNDRFGSANLPLDDLVEETRISRRHLRRLLSGLNGILDYVPGRGEKHFGQFGFPGLVPTPKLVEKPVDIDAGVKQEEDRKRTGRGQEEDAQGPPIRKDLNLNLDQKQTPLPPFSKGEPVYRLTHRDHTRLSRYWDRDRNTLRHDGKGKTDTWGELLRLACADLALPIDAAEHDLLLMDAELWSARLELRKAPQSA